MNVETRQDGRSTRWKAHREARRVEIIAAAAEVIERGGGELRLEDLAAETGIARPLLYRHFEGRAELEACVLQLVAKSLLTEFSTSVREGGELPERVAMTTRAYVNWVSRHQNLTRYATRNAPVRQIESFRATVAAQIGSAISESHHEAAPEGIEELAHAVVGLADGAIAWWLDNSESMPTDELSQRIAVQVLAVIETAG